MNENKTITLNELNFHDLLTVDVYDKTINISIDNNTEPLITKRQFFSDDGLYVEPEDKGLVLIEDKGLTKTKKRKRTPITVDKIYTLFNDNDNSVVALIEGYAGCGKSTLVQSILTRQCGVYSEYSLYNYNIEAQNRLISFENGKRIANSSILNSIKLCFINTFCNVYNVKSVLSDFKLLANYCQYFHQFMPLYFDFVNTDSLVVNP